METILQESQADYTQKRKDHYNALAEQWAISRKLGTHYQHQLHAYYRQAIPSGSRILEVGCGQGDLLNALSPAEGIGIDLSPAMVELARKRHPHLTFIEGSAQDIPENSPFDVIILSDLVNELWDVQHVLTRLRKQCHSGTRLILNFHNNLWSPVLSLLKKAGWIHPFLKQNWLTPEDIENLLVLSGFETVQQRPAILLPLNLPIITPFFNRIFANLPVFRAFDLTHFFTARPAAEAHKENASVSVIIPARNEAGHIESLLQRTPEMGTSTELIFVEGGSTDNTYTEIEKQIAAHPERTCRLIRQTGIGKGDAVRAGFERAQGDVLMILDADLTVAPEDLPLFYDALTSGKGEFINGVRLVYPLGEDSMRFCNMVGNKFFGILFSWLLGQPIRDTLCGTKVLWKNDYQKIVANRSFFGKTDPFGDFDLLFGAARMSLKILEIPIRYGARTYGQTNISRWQHGALLLRMACKAAFKIKFF